MTDKLKKLLSVAALVSRSSFGHSYNDRYSSLRDKQRAEQVQLQRYEPEIFREDRIRMEPDGEGDWVKFSDVCAMLAEAPQVAQQAEQVQRTPIFTTGQLRDYGDRRAAAVLQETNHFPDAGNTVVEEALQRLSDIHQEMEAGKKPVAAQHRFRHPQKGTPDWSVWQPCKVSQRPGWEVDSQGYEVEYRALYTHPAPEAKQERKPLTDEQIDKAVDAAAVSFRHHKYSIRGQQLSAQDVFETHFARAIEATHGIGKGEDT